MGGIFKITKFTMINLPYYPIINFYIKKYNYTSYLELGVRDKTNTYNLIECSEKNGVDINPNCFPDYLMTTDDFFNTISKDKKWDIIFIDADHEKEQVMKDLLNSLNHLNENGTIIMDDINPFTEELTNPLFCHNAWEVFATLRKNRDDLEMYGIESSFCGIVRRGKQITHNLEIESNFKFLNENRQVLLNIKKWEQILNE
jgi:hypothetical protein